ncbi:hypothetical protein D3C78_1382780 [compost metagenome]
MGYDILGYNKKSDENSKIHIQCQYTYQSVFKSCFGKDILYFNGRVTKNQIKEFEDGVLLFQKHPEHFNLDDKMYVGNLANNSYKNLSDELFDLLELMKNNEVRYLSIG